MGVAEGPQRAPELGRLRRRAGVGAAAIALALLFNAPYAILATTFDYPDILRRPASEVLAAFADGGAALILTWHAFALTALALAPLAVALSITRERMREEPGLAIGAAVLGALAGLSQAIGLWRWVFVVPALSRPFADPAGDAGAREAAAQAFDVIHLYGGVAIGEHLGQLLTALFVAALSSLQWKERARLSGALGMLTAVAIAIGTGEGLAIALGAPGDAFALFTIAGFLALTAWLIATGVGLVRGAGAQPQTVR